METNTGNINSKSQLCADLEIYVNRFILGICDYHTEERSSYEIHSELDDRQKLYRFLANYRGFWITFNGISYDNVVLAYGQRNKWWPQLSADECCQKLKAFSDDVINTRNAVKKQSTKTETVNLFTGFDDSVITYEKAIKQLVEEDDRLEQLWYSKFNKYIDYFGFTDIDLYLYWSKLLRLSKKISLKGLGIQLGYPIVQELPYDPSMWLTPDQWNDVKIYNLEHDLGILLLLTKNMQGDIVLRQSILQNNGLACWSMDAPKIASELLLKDYCSKTGASILEVRKERYYRSTINIRELLSDIKPDYVNPTLQKLFTDLCNSQDSFSREFNLFSKEGKGLKISFGVGGLHSVNNNEYYESDNKYVIVTSDAASMYPNLIRKYKAFRQKEVLDKYCEVIDLRLNETKPNLKAARGNKELEFHWKLIDTVYKLILNSISGLLDMEHSWLYNPSGILKVRFGGQLILLKLVDMCLEEGWDVISCNTDGIEIKIPRDQLDYYYNTVIPKLEEWCGLIFEHDVYNSIAYQNVNSYIAITDSGQVKKKGVFVTQPELTNSVDNLIIPKLLQCYFESGIKPEEIISQLDTFSYKWDKDIKQLHIYDFCASKKMDRSYGVMWNNLPQQRLNRYFVAKNGAYLYKTRHGKSQHMLKGFGVQIYNNHVEQSLSSYQINFSYYLDQVNSIINEIQPKQLNLF